MNAEVDALVAKWRKQADTHANYRPDAADDIRHVHMVKAKRLRDCADELEALAARPAAPTVDTTLENISAVARRALSFGHQATPQTPERMIERKDDALRRIHELTGVSGSVLRAAPVGEAERLREALQRCHRLMEQAVGYVDPEDSPALVDAIHAELRLCDEAGICPGLASPAPQPAAPAPVEPQPFGNAEEFDPGIRDVVIRLNKAGFKTTDSGDGVSKAEAIAAGEALPFRHVACAASRSSMFSEADRLVALLGPGWLVEASYHPPRGHCLLFASEAEQVGS